MPTSNRMLRVNELLRRELGLQVEKLISPNVDALVTVTGVKTAPDLRNATVLVSILGSEEQKHSVLRLLGESRKALQAAVSRNIMLKYTPVLRFREDSTSERADRILSILDELDVDSLEEETGPEKV